MPKGTAACLLTLRFRRAQGDPNLFDKVLEVAQSLLQKTIHDLVVNCALGTHENIAEALHGLESLAHISGDNTSLLQLLEEVVLLGGQAQA